MGSVINMFAVGFNFEILFKVLNKRSLLPPVSERELSRLNINTPLIENYRLLGKTCLFGLPRVPFALSGKTPW